MGKKKIVVLHSGGLDSTVCLHMAVSRGHDVVSIGVNYNQHHHIELDYAAKQCARLGRVIEGPRWPVFHGDSWATFWRDYPTTNPTAS